MVVDPPQAQLEPYLRPGERLLWAGRPDPSVTFTRADALLVPFSVLWGGFAIFWEIGVLASGAPILFTLWGIPFVAAGLYFMVGRFVYKKRRKLRTAYGLTPERALVAVGASALDDSPVRHVPTSVRRTRDGRHVSVSFGSHGRWSRAAFYGNTGMEFFNFADGPVAFYDVADGEALLAALDRARRE